MIRLRSIGLVVAIAGSVAMSTSTASAAPLGSQPAARSSPPTRSVGLPAKARSPSPSTPKAASTIAPTSTSHHELLSTAARANGKRLAPSASRRTAADHAALQADLNAPLAAAFPRLEIVLRDPDAFIAKMSERFAQQKRLTPSDPHQFDYSEVGIPLVKDMRADLTAKISELSKSTEGPSASDRRIAVEHMTALVGEADHHLKNGTITYRNMVELSHFYGRAIGQFDKKKLPLFKRSFLKVDEKLEGFAQRSPAEELADYKARRFSVFDPSEKTRSSGFAAAQGSFEQAVFDHNELKTIIVPTNDELTQHLLLRLASREKINMVGVTSKPILADGFMRPSALFWTHDMRHQSAKFFRKNAYVGQEHLSTEQVGELNRMMDGFYVDLRHETNAIADPHLREAVKLLTFNFFFDRGYPMVPSSYLNNPRDHITHALYVGEKIGGQEVKFDKPFANLKRADTWMRAFWQERQTTEREFLARKTTPQ